MGIEIILYDSSPIIQKIFLHVLYHYRPIVHRIEQTSKLMEKIQYNKPDIMFIDTSVSKDIKNQMNRQKEDLKNIPIILMTKENISQKELKSFVAHGFLKKPIEAGALRAIINHFVPKTKSNILNQYLTFPSIPDFEEETNETEIPQRGLTTPLSSQSAPDTHQAPYSSANIEEGIKPVTDTPSTKTGAPPVQSFNQTVSTKKTGAPPPVPSFNQPVSTKKTGAPPPVPSFNQPVSTKKTGAPPVQSFNQTVSTKSRFSDEGGIKPVTDTPSTKTGAPPVQSFNQTVSTKSRFFDECGIKPVTDAPSTKKAGASREQTTQQQSSETDNISTPPLHHTLYREDRDNAATENNRKNGTNVKILQVPLEARPDKEANKKNIPDKPEISAQLKDEIIKNIKNRTKNEIKEEMKKELKYFVEQNNQELIKKIVEKAVWQVVPEMAKQLIIKELDKLLKEAENQKE